MLVLGAGPGGYSAAFRSADLGMQTVLVERYPTLGGVCLNVGCIPSKALLHITGVMDEAQHMADCGVSFGAPSIDLDRLRAHKDKVVGKLTGGLAGMAKGRKVEVVQGVGQFVDPHHLEVTLAGGGSKLIRFQKAIIAAGSQPIALPFMPNDPRVVDSTGALELRQIPKRMLVVGGGIIGLEMASVYSALGSRITVVELGAVLMPGADRDLVKVWEKKNAHRFDRILLNTGVVAATATAEGIEVTYSNDEKEASTSCWSPSAARRTARSSPPKRPASPSMSAASSPSIRSCEPMSRTSTPSATSSGSRCWRTRACMKRTSPPKPRTAASAASTPCRSRRWPTPTRKSPGPARPKSSAGPKGSPTARASSPGRRRDARWPMAGRGLHQADLRRKTHRIIGGSIVGTDAGDLIGEVCLAIEMGCDATDIGHTIHPHPTLGESVGMAAEVYEGVCTDLPAVKKR
jgi:dihydrolipoamide dehydrogenase